VRFGLSSSVDPRVPEESGPEKGFKVILVHALERFSHGLKAAVSISQGAPLSPRALIRIPVPEDRTKAARSGSSGSMNQNE